MFHFIFFCFIAEENYCVYDLRMHYIYGSPDGVLKRILAFNGQFPGPTLRCARGKWMVVRKLRYKSIKLLRHAYPIGFFRRCD